MKIMRSLVVSLATILLFASVIHGQDLSKYRNFSFGMSWAEVSNQNLKPLQTKLVHERPAVIQELTWWPSSGSSLQADPASQIFFTFSNGELYRILVTYDRRATDGLTAEDMIQAISVQYGTAARPDAQISFPTNELYRSTEKVIARWEDSQYSINLFRSSFLNTFGLVMFSKRLDGQAEVAITQALKLEKRDAPQKEAARMKKEANDLGVARQKNKEAFRP
jgi:hypothetical protein